ncbi:MAG: histidine kinase dimerization/phospho-acceptor domain-containing protein, partial [Pseudomonadota bacterium]
VEGAMNSGRQVKDGEDLATTGIAVDDVIGFIDDSAGADQAEVRESRGEIGRSLVEAWLRAIAEPEDASIGEVVGWRAAALGRRAAELGMAVTSVVRVGHLLTGAVAEAVEDRGSQSAPERRRLRRLANGVLTSLVEAHASAMSERWDRWLSFYVHELRNPLNTMVNAVWLLRTTDRGPKTQRVCDIADRAAKKLEGIIRDLRGLEKTVLSSAS